MDANHQQTTKKPQEDLEMQHKSETEGGMRQHAGCAAQSPSNKKTLKEEIKGGIWGETELIL